MEYKWNILFKVIIYHLKIAYSNTRNEKSVASSKQVQEWRIGGEEVVDNIKEIVELILGGTEFFFKGRRNQVESMFSEENIKI